MKRLGNPSPNPIRYSVVVLGKVVTGDSLRRTKAANVYKARVLWEARVKQTTSKSLAKVIDNEESFTSGCTHIILKEFKELNFSKKIGEKLA